MPPDSSVLEHLAASGWFARHGEVALTAGLTFCLEKDPVAAQAFIQLVRVRNGLPDLPSPVRWKAEGVTDARGRVDVVGWLVTETERAPVVFVEAKVSAVFERRQVSSYVESLELSLRQVGIGPGVLVVLVPEGRVSAARKEVAADLERLGATEQSDPWSVTGDAGVIVTVISWDEALGAMLGEADRAAGDLEQLLGACRALHGIDVPAFTIEDLDDWQARTIDLQRMIDRVTREATLELSLTLAPWQFGPSQGLNGGYRYLAPRGRPNLAVGMRMPGTSSPLWVRWHKRTSEFDSVAIRLSAAGHSIERDEFGIWLPLKLEPDAGSAARQIEELVAQVVRLFRTSLGEEEGLLRPAP